jgi:hypothetical protein
MNEKGQRGEGRASTNKTKTNREPSSSSLFVAINEYQKLNQKIDTRVSHGNQKNVPIPAYPDVEEEWRRRPC